MSLSKKIVLIILFFSLAIPVSTSTHESESANERKYLIGYLYPGNRLIEEQEIAGSLMTHIIYAFANIEDGKLVQGFDTDAENFAVLRSVRGKNPQLKLMVAVGGWTWSGAFSDMALTAQNRSRFIESVTEFLRKHELDGVDLDWEYPGMPGNNNTHRPEDKENFTALITELREALDAISHDGKHYLLTIAAGSFKNYLEHVEMDKISPHLNFINLMTYDFTGEWGQMTGHHANLFTPANSPEVLSADMGVELFINAGAPREKLVIGAAFYGRGWRSVLPARNGFGQSGVGLQGVDLSYNNIVREFIPNPIYEQHWDHPARAPFLWNPNDSIFITYETPRSMREKARYVNEQNLKGVMFWQYFSDYENQLLKALAEGLRARR